MNHRHDAETYDDREGATLGRIHIERSFQGDLEGQATAELLTATAANGAAVYLALDRISGRQRRPSLNPSEDTRFDHAR